jgi:hypothetical protein
MAGKRLIARPMPSALAMALASYLFGRKRHVMRPSALEITAGDFAFATDHRRIAISLLAGTLNSTAAFSIDSSSASTSPSQTALPRSLGSPMGRLTGLRGAGFDKSGHKEGPAVTGPSLGH